MAMQFNSNRFWWFYFDLQEVLTDNGPTRSPITGNTVRMGMKANAPQLWRIKIESNDIVLDDGRIMRIAETIIPERKISRKEIPEVISNYLNEVTLPMLKDYHLDVSDFDVVIGCWCPK